MMLKQRIDADALDCEWRLSCYSASDIAEMFNCSESSLKSNFYRTAASIKKKYNVDIVKSKDKNKNVFYQVFENDRAKTIYDQKKDISITLESLSFQAFEFCVFLMLAANEVFRGTRKQLLDYMGIKNLKKNIQILNKVIKSLVEKNYIGFNEDQDYIILYLKRCVQRQNQITIEMLRQCKRIADEQKKNFNKFVQLIQVWGAIRVCQKNQPFAYKDLSELTGLSFKQIRDVKKLLERNDAFLKKRAGNYFKCLGMNVDLNAFYN